MVAQPVHIDINQEIQDWKTARYGREVRKASAGAFTKLQNQMNGAVDYLVEKGETVDQTVNDVQEVRQEAKDAVDHANEITAEYKQYADEKLAATEQERQAAEAAQGVAEDAAVLSQSWAIGGTAGRPGEESNNSRYYSEQSKTEADRSTSEADRAAQYANIVAPGFYVDPVTMELYMKAGVGVDFDVFDDNVLYWKIA